MLKSVLVIALISVIMSCQSKKEEVQNSDIMEKEGATPMEGLPLLIGTYTRDEGWVNGKAQGIQLAYLHEGKVSVNKTIPAGQNPSYLAKHPRENFIYIANELGSAEGENAGTVTAMKYDGDMNFEEINVRQGKGVGSCHISVSDLGYYVYTANYGGGDIAAYPIALDGRTGGSGGNAISFSGSGPHERQDKPHLHFIKEGVGGLIYAVDLGTDSVYVFKMENGLLKRHNNQIKVASGAGPRHLEFFDEAKTIYVLNELNGTIEVWRYYSDRPFERVQTISTLPEGATGFAHSGAIKMTSKNQYLYATNRADHSNIAGFRVLLDGTLELIGHTPTKGKIPRDIALSPDDNYLVVANQDSDNLVTYEIDLSTGSLKNGKETKGVPTPVCLVFL